MKRALCILFLFADFVTVCPAQFFGGGGKQTHTINLVVDNGGSAIAPGDLNYFLTVPAAAQGGFSCRIVGASIAADQPGTIQIAVWKANAAIPTVANLISAAAPIKLTAAQLNANSPLTGWTATAVVPGDVFGFSVTAAATVTRVSATLWCR